MGAAIYPVLERELEGVDTQTNGKALARYESELAALAKTLGVPDLMSFHSVSADEVADFLEMDLSDAAPDAETLEMPSEQWHEAIAGLAAVRALREKIEADRDGVSDAAAIGEDLAELERVLTVASERGVRFHLAVDF